MYTPCLLTNPDRWAGLHDPAEKKSLHKSWPLENSSEQEKAPAICDTCAAGRGDRAGDVTLQLPKPCRRAGAEGTGWAQDIRDVEQLAGTRGRAVMDEGTSPQGQEEGAGLCFSGCESQEGRTGPGGGSRLYPCTPPSHLQLEHHAAHGGARVRAPLPSPGG